jgi:hypothetical protein
MKAEPNVKSLSTAIVGVQADTNPDGLLPGAARPLRRTDTAFSSVRRDHQIVHLRYSSRMKRIVVGRPFERSVSDRFSVLECEQDDPSSMLTVEQILGPKSDVGLPRRAAGNTSD